MRLQLMTWPEVEKYLKYSQGVIIPIGATEQHGPTGLIGTDAICAETLAWKAGELADTVVGPTLFRRFFFVNGHGGNTASINAAFFEVYAEAPQLVEGGDEVRCLNGEWWETPSARRLSAELFGDSDGDHATASEISVAAAAFPDHVKTAELAAEAAPSSYVFGPADFRHRYPEGRMGSHPELASVEAGERIIEAVADDLAKDYRVFLTEE
ncbi:MAG: creatininase family protein [Acidobacteriota bacterium]